MAIKKHQNSSNQLQHIWSILCQSSSVDQKSQNISLFNVIEQINIQRNANNTNNGAPVKIPFPTHLVVLLRKLDKSDSTGSMKIEIIDPENKTLDSKITPINITDLTKDRWRFIFSIPTMTITTPGYYTFRILLKINTANYVTINELPLSVTINSV